MHVKSADQKLDREFDFSATISGNGFYKWVDRITRDNGKPDCNRVKGNEGRVTTSYELRALPPHRAAFHPLSQGRSGHVLRPVRAAGPDVSASAHHPACRFTRCG
jgi:hypothetical protein